MPRAGAIFRRDMLGIGPNLLLSNFLIQKSDFFPKKSVLVRPLRKYGVTKSIAMTAILFSRVLEKKYI